MSSIKKGVTSEQIRQAAKDLNLTVAAIAEGTGLSKAYVSEFRNETRNLSATQQTQLRTFLEEQYEAAGMDFPEAEDSSDSELLQGLGGMVKRITRPAILLSENIPQAQAEQLLDMIERNRLKVGDLLVSEFEPGGFFGGDFSEATEATIRELFALLALNYLAILMLQGRNIASKIQVEEFEPKTVGDWLSTYLAGTDLAELLPVASTPTKSNGKAKANEKEAA